MICRVVAEIWNTSLPRKCKTAFLYNFFICESTTDLSKFENEVSLFRGHSVAIAIGHGQVDLSAVTPHLGRMNWYPFRHQPSEKTHVASIRWHCPMVKTFQIIHMTLEQYLKNCKSK